MKPNRLAAGQSACADRGDCQLPPYVASYHLDNGGYAADQNTLTASVDRGPLHVLASGGSGGNGVYMYGPSAFPINTYNATNYWVDVVFNTTATVPTNTPTPTPTATPTAGPPGTCPCTLFPASAVPTNVANADPSSVELGMKFRPDVNGRVTGAVLQGVDQYGDAHREAVDEHRDVAGDGDVHGRVRFRLAAGEFRDAGVGHRQHHVCDLVPHQYRELLGRPVRTSPARSIERRCTRRPRRRAVATGSIRTALARSRPARSTRPTTGWTSSSSPRNGPGVPGRPASSTRNRLLPGFANDLVPQAAAAIGGGFGFGGLEL